MENECGKCRLQKMAENSIFGKLSIAKIQGIMGQCHPGNYKKPQMAQLTQLPRV